MIRPDRGVDPNIIRRLCLQPYPNKIATPQLNFSQDIAAPGKCLWVVVPEEAAAAEGKFYSKKVFEIGVRGFGGREGGGGGGTLGRR